MSSSDSEENFDISFEDEFGDEFDESFKEEYEEKSGKNSEKSFEELAKKDSEKVAANITSFDGESLNISSEEYSDDILCQILLRAHQKTLAKCMQSNRRFYNLISNNWFWIDYARINHMFNVLPSLEWRTAATQKNFVNEKGIDTSSFDFNLKRMVLTGRGYSPKMFKFESEFRNRSAEGFYCNRNITTDEYSVEAGIQMETHGGIGCQPHPAVSKCFAFSYVKRSIFSYVDLVGSGIDTWVLDYVRPTIRISQKVNHRHDCAAKLQLSAQLCHQKRQWIHEHETMPRNFNDRGYKSMYKEWDQWTDDEWEDWVLEFDDYPSGMRYLTVKNTGSDRQFWAGFYGPKIANVTVEVIMPEEPIIKSLAPDPEIWQEEHE